MAADSGNRSDRQWQIIERWQEYDGEKRANLLRLIAIAAFYSIHLYDYRSGKALLEGDALESLKRFHLAVTCLAVAWTMLSLGVLLCLRQRIFPRWLKFVSTGGDLVLLTSILCVGSGPRSPLIAAYFLIIILSGLRLSLPLVRCSTVGAMLGYIVLLGLAKWPERFGRAGAELQVPRFEQLMLLAALALSGVTLGQIIRRVREMAEELHSRLQTVGTDNP